MCVVVGSSGTGRIGTDAALAAQESEIVSEHFHNRERWLSKLAVPAGNRVTTQGLTAFQIDSGNNTWGAAVQILDSADTPQIAGKTMFDLRMVIFVASERSSPYLLQFIWGASANAGIAAGTYTELMYQPMIATPPTQHRGPLELRMPRLPAHTLVWVRCWNGENTGTLDFMFGIHEYDV